MTPDLPDRDTLARMFHRDVSKCPCGEPDPLDYIYADAVLAAGWRPPTPATDRLRAEQDAVHADLIAILTALGIGAHARPYSGHEVVQREVLPAIRRLTETRLCDCPPTPATDGLRERIVAQVLNERLSHQSRHGASAWMDVAEAVVAALDATAPPTPATDGTWCRSTWQHEPHGIEWANGARAWCPGVEATRDVEAPFDILGPPTPATDRLRERIEKLIRNAGSTPYFGYVKVNALRAALDATDQPGENT